MFGEKREYGLTIEQRLMKYCIPVTESGCWLWFGACSKTAGHGILRVNGRTTKAHRLMWETQRSAIPPGKGVLHKCDVACCVNPDHLYIGTHKDNMRDLWTRKPPRRVGNGVGRAKLTEAQVLEIRKSKLSQRKLAKIYGVANGTICRARRGNTWAHVKSVRVEVADAS